MYKYSRQILSYMILDLTKMCDSHPIEKNRFNLFYSEITFLNVKKMKTKGSNYFSINIYVIKFLH